MLTTRKPSNHLVVLGWQNTTPVSVSHWFHTRVNTSLAVSACGLAVSKAKIRARVAQNKCPACQAVLDINEVAVKIQTRKEAKLTPKP